MSDLSKAVRLIRNQVIGFQYIEITLVKDLPKTRIWIVLNKRSRDRLGEIKWHSQWRQYCFYPYPNRIFSNGCLNDIADFITIEMEKRK